MSIIFFLIVQCDDPDADYEDICGYGATGCLGNATDPICQCDTELQMVPASDGRSCVPGKKAFMFVYHLCVSGQSVNYSKRVSKALPTYTRRTLNVRKSTLKRHRKVLEKLTFLTP